MKLRILVAKLANSQLKTERGPSPTLGSQYPSNTEPNILSFGRPRKDSQRGVFAQASLVISRWLHNEINSINILQYPVKVD
mmetsp:Transcript_14809/g.22993  ORF Transcript_14809/g.22993 Transcript_14809/m.22993 type:complete len:81 (-) Transcript_14809:755-997(-)